jgi:predicted nucleic acid-binding Zn ribbon protein
MSTTLPMQQCLACQKPLKGRIDKKFCDDYCRNNFNNKNNSDATNLVRNINNILRKNRRILQDLLANAADGQTIVKSSKNKMLELGYQFKYFTNTYKTKKGDVYYFCYEFGFLPLENEWFFIVKSKESE